MVIERIREHRSHQADVVRARGSVGNVVRELRAAFSIRLENARTRQHRSRRFDERQLHLLGHRFRQRLAMPLLQARFRVKQIGLAGAAFHEHEDDALGLALEMALLRRQRIGIRCRKVVARQQVGQGDVAHSARDITEKSTSGIRSHLHYSLVINSSRFISTRPTLAHACCSIVAAGLPSLRSSSDC